MPELDQVYFLSEIVVQPDDMGARCHTLGAKLVRGGSVRPLRSELAILAVNCAYYDYDNSFRAHFCERLGIPISLWDISLGPEIEKFLQEKGLLRRKRSGGFRYVGAILEQCGITQSCLPSFANILNSLAATSGWENILSLDLATFRHVIPEIGPKYLRTFLEDEAGWEFSLDISRNIAQYRRGLISINQLVSLPGYRRGFWEQLLTHLTIPKPPFKRKLTIPDPRLIFNLDMNAIELRIDAGSVQIGAYKLNGNIVVGNSIKLRSEVDFSSQYKFEIRQSDGWISRIIPGWDPLIRDFAFFSLSTGYVDDVKRLKIGEYYLLVKEADHVPSGMIRTDHGFVSLPFGYFNLFQVEITPETDLSVFGCSGQEKLLPFFQWGDGLPRLECAADVCDVFVGTPPRVKVHNISQFKKNEVMLIIEVEGKQRRILPSDLEITNLIDFARFGMEIPGRGSIWVEPLCRSGTYAGKDVVERLDFVVICESNVHWPRQLIGYNVDVEIVLTSKSGYSLYFDAGQSLDSPQTKWSIPSEIHVAEGLLSVGEIPIRICCRFHRANIERKVKDQANINTVLWRDDLDIGIELLAEGVANQPVEVSLGVKSVISRLCMFNAFNQNGAKEFNTYSFRDALLSLEPIAGRFILNYCSTGLYYLDAVRLKDSVIRHGNQSSDIIALSDIHPSIRPTIELLYAVAGNRLTQIEDKPETALPAQLVFAYDLIACACVFDGVCRSDEIVFLENTTLAMKELIEWYWKAQNVADDDFSQAHALSSLLSSMVLPDLLRWREKIEAAKSRLDAIVDIRNWLTNWVREILGPQKLHYLSEIACLSGGHDLVYSWRLYKNLDQHKQAYLATKKVYDQHAGIVRELAAILAIVTLKKLNRTEYCHDYLKSEGHDLLIQAKRALCGQGAWPQELNKEHLPLRDEDWDNFLR